MHVEKAVLLYGVEIVLLSYLLSVHVQKAVLHGVEFFYAEYLFWGWILKKLGPSVNWLKLAMYPYYPSNKILYGNVRNYLFHFADLK